MEIANSGNITGGIGLSGYTGWENRTVEVRSAGVRAVTDSVAVGPVRRLSNWLGWEQLAAVVAVPTARDMAVIKAVSAYSHASDDGTGLRVRLADFFEKLIDETNDLVPPGPSTPVTREELTDFGLVVGDRLLLAALETGISDYRHRAKVILSNYADDHSDVALVNDRLGLIAYLDGDTDTALSYYRTALSQSATNAGYKLSVGWLNLQKGETSAAEFYFDQVLETDPNNGVALALLGATAGRAGEAEAAVSYFEKAVGVEPGNPTVHYWYGRFFADEGRNRDADIAFRVAARKFDRVDAYWVYTPTLSDINKEIYSLLRT
ncbi:tetratricopeptide repeat protein [candidate division KSB1 bacterium]